MVKKNAHFKTFSHLFYNIDGNNKNFDNMLCYFVKSKNFDFTVIGLAERNSKISITCQ